MAYCCSEIKHSLSLCSFYATCIKLETDFEMQMSFQQEVKSKRNPFPSPQKRLLKKNCTHDWFPWITHPLHHLRDTHVTMLLKKISPSACSILDIQSTSINTPISHQVSIMCLWKWWHECYRCCMWLTEQLTIYNERLSAPDLSLCLTPRPLLLIQCLQSSIIIYRIVEKMYVCMYDPALIQVFLYNPIMMQYPACNQTVQYKSIKTTLCCYNSFLVLHTDRSRQQRCVCKEFIRCVSVGFFFLIFFRTYFEAKCRIQPIKREELCIIY